MKQWFKLTDTTVMSLKWQRMARKLGVSPAVVSFVYIAAMSCASVSEANGSLRDFHAILTPLAASMTARQPVSLKLSLSQHDHGRRLHRRLEQIL